MCFVSRIRQTWDWPEDVVPKGAAERAAKTLMAAVTASIKKDWRAAISPWRLSYAWAGVVFIAGAAFGLYVGAHWWRDGVVDASGAAVRGSALRAGITEPAGTYDAARVNRTLDELPARNGPRAAGAKPNGINR